MSISTYFILLTLFTCQIHDTQSFDFIGKIESWLWSKLELMKSRKIITGVQAELEYIKQLEQLIPYVENLQREHAEIYKTMREWQEYMKRSNFFFRLLIGFFILPRWENKEKIKGQELVEARYKTKFEPFCAHRYYRHRLQYNEICEQAFQSKFFIDKNWILKSENSTTCREIVVSTMENDGSTSKPRRIKSGQEVRRCLATDIFGKVEFYVFVAAGLSYNTSMTTQFPFFVFVERDVMNGKAFNTPYNFREPYQNYDRVVVAYIE